MPPALLVAGGRSSSDSESDGLALGDFDGDLEGTVELGAGDVDPGDERTDDRVGELLPDRCRLGELGEPADGLGAEPLEPVDGDRCGRVG